MTAPAPVFIVNHLSENIAKRGSILESISNDVGAVLHNQDIFDCLDIITTQTRKDGHDWVFIEGGDGTCQGVITAFLEHYGTDTPLPRFTLIPGGMTNQVAGVIGLKRPNKERIKTLLDGMFTKKELPLVKVQSNTNSASYAGFLFSTGAIPMITEYTKQQLHNRGIGGSMAVIGGIIRGASGNGDVMYPTPIDISIAPNTQFSESHLGTVITTLPSLFKGLDPFWGKEDGPLRITYARGDYRRLFANIISLWRGRMDKDRSKDGLFSYNTSTITMHYDGDIVLDGEALTLLGPDFTLIPSRPVSFLC